MAPVTIQGLFNLYYDIIFFLLAIKIYRVYQKDHNIFARYLSYAFAAGAIEYLFIALPLLFIPSNLFVMKISGFIAWIISYFVVAFIWIGAANVYPRFKIKTALAVLTGIWALLLYWYFVPYKGAFINSAQIMDWGQTQTILLGGIVFSVTYVAIGAVFIYHAIRKHFFLKAATFGLGLTIYLLFLPITYQVTQFQTFIFFNLLASLGFTLLAIGVFL